MKRLPILIILLTLAFTIGCEKKSAEPEGSDNKVAKQEKTGYLIGFSQCTFEDPWRINMNNQMKAAAALHPEIKLMIANGENRNPKQISDVENFIVRGVDLLIISPREAAPLTPVVEKAFDKGIPVVVLARAIMSEKYTTFIGASNLEIGRAAGKYLLETLPDGAKIIEIAGILGATPTQERSRGFHEIVDPKSEYEVIYNQPGDYKRSPAMQVMQNALQAHRSISTVYAHNDEMAIGAYLAAKAAGREKDILFIGIDGQGEAVKMIRDGLLHATFVYPNGAKEAIEYGLKALKGEQAPKKITLGTTLITQSENLKYAGF